jgi:maleylpyruvate isomerase
MASAQRDGRTVVAGRTGEWLTTVAAMFRAQVDELPDAALNHPTLLPDISRRQLIGHMRYSALLLGMLAHASATGEQQVRDEQVERWADWPCHSVRQPARHLRDIVRWSEEDLEVAFERLAATPSASVVAEIPGLHVPASRLPWLRVRELAVHVVDLNTGVGFADLPSDLVLALAHDALETHETALPDLLGWLTGRTQSPIESRPRRSFPCLSIGSALSPRPARSMTV